MAKDFEDQMLQDAEEDRQTVEFIQAYLPQELKERFSEDDLYYFLDLLVDYYATSGVLDQEPDEDGCIDLDIEQIAAELYKTAKKEKYGDFTADEIRWIVEGEMEFSEQFAEEED